MGDLNVVVAAAVHLRSQVGALSTVKPRYMPHYIWDR